MMRLPRFRFVSPESLAEAVDVLAAASPGDAAIVAGGTDLIPNMKRRQQTPGTLVGLRRIAELREIRSGGLPVARRDGARVAGEGIAIGAGVTLTQLLHALPAGSESPLAGLREAARQVATPHLRNMGTIGGNLCLDTRCTYYDQNYEWRKAIDFCMKKDGETCWVATSSPRCLAVSSTDTAPALIALGADVTLTSAAGPRTVPVTSLYQNDGIHYLTRTPTEILSTVHVPPLDGWRSTYWKLRRRGSFDFPVLSVAAAVKIGRDGVVEDARIVLGAVASRPLEATAGNALLVGDVLTDERIAAAADAAAQPARPMDNTDFTLHWRKRVTTTFVAYALRTLRGDDMRNERLRVARQLL
jgi:4-hydroxybenzoyl-CoA reductase subunit beta